MNGTIARLAAIVICGVSSLTRADYKVLDEGVWPATWPKALEPLRHQARSAFGPMDPNQHHEIPFTEPKQFEELWPHLLKVKSQGAPLILVQGPDTWLSHTLSAGVRIHGPPAQTDWESYPEKPIPGQRDVRRRWAWTTYIELIVDGEVVDLNRIPLPADTPIVDERFKDDDSEENAEGNQNRGRGTSDPQWPAANVPVDAGEP